MLVYTSNPLRRDLEVTGPVRVVLFVSSNVRDTDFTAKLVDVFPDGRARILCDGILRLRFRQGLERAVRYERGKFERIDIPAGVTSNVFRAGHRIRLEVASSNFPKYDRNLNTGHPQADEKDWRTAIQESAPRQAVGEPCSAACRDAVAAPQTGTIRASYAPRIHG